jgi:hypothetical protein
MNIKVLFAISIIVGLSSCQNKTTQIADNTFVYNDKIFKLIDNELTQMGDLNSKNIRKFEVLKPQEKNLGTQTLSYISRSAVAKVDALYRGNFLYFKLYIEGINDLKERYYPGKFTLKFVDEYGFLLHSTELLTSDLIGMINDDGKVDHFEFLGKTEMSTEINKAIKTFTVSSTVKEK